MPGEFIVLAAVIDAGNVALPATVARLIKHAPESFENAQAGQVATIVRAMLAKAEPINFHIVGKKHPQFLDFITRELAPAALDLISAESEALGCWNAYEVRQANKITEDITRSLAAAPKQARSIIAAARSSFDDLISDVQVSTFTIRTPDEILAMEFDDSVIILGDWIMAECQSTVIAGAGGVGKSRWLLQLAACVTTGRKFLNFQTGKENAKWLILQTENSNRRLRDDLARLKAWLGDDWPKFAARVKIHTVENDADGTVNLDIPEAVANIQAAIKAHAPDIVVIDPLNHFNIGDLNKDADMMVTLQTLSRICRKGNPKRAIVVLHHALTGKAGSSRATGYDRASFSRNSKVLLGWTRAQINLAPVDAENNERLIVACGKCSNGREFQTFGIRLDPETTIYECDPTVDVNQWEKDMAGAKDKSPQTNPDRVRELCDIAGMTKKALSMAIIADCGCVRGQSYKLIDRAIEARTIAFNKTNEKCFRK